MINIAMAVKLKNEKILYIVFVSPWMGLMKDYKIYRRFAYQTTKSVKAITLNRKIENRYLKINHGKKT